MLSPDVALLSSIKDPRICLYIPILSRSQGLHVFSHLLNISEVMNFLSQSDADRLVHVFTSKLNIHVIHFYQAAEQLVLQLLLLRR